MATPVCNARKFVFIWENLGPSHLDRVAALAATLQADSSVVAIQFFGKSSVYQWDSAHVMPFEIITLQRERKSKHSLSLTFSLIRECLKIGRADIFLCHYEKVPVLLTAIIMRLLGRKIFAMGDSKFDDYDRRLFTEFIKRFFFLPYHGALTASRRSRDYMRFFGFDHDRIELGYDSLSVDRIASLSGQPLAPDGLPFINRDFVIVARLVPKKNLGVALEAFALWLTQTCHPRDLHICGSGPLENDLRSHVAQLNITDRVHFHGFIQTDAISRILARSLCLILTSTEEQFGLVVIEAQAVGLPVLVTANAGACDELIEPGINGYILDPRNPRSCAALMLALSEDEAVWRRFAIAARETRYRGDSRHFVASVLQLTGLTAAEAQSAA
jgi:glycosyltransferase involved in cell wall biosynthesis